MRPTRHGHAPPTPSPLGAAQLRQKNGVYLGLRPGAVTLVDDSYFGSPYGGGSASGAGAVSRSQRTATPSAPAADRSLDRLSSRDQSEAVGGGASSSECGTRAVAMGGSCGGSSRAPRSCQ